MHNNMLKVEGYDSLYRDPSTKAIINNDRDAYNKYISVREKKKQEKSEINNMRNDINKLQQDLTDIKSLLMTLVEQKGK